MSGLDQLWAGWRLAYLESVVDGRAGLPSGTPADPPPGDGTLFERILALGDREGFVVHRGATCSSVLNAYPYSNGHLLVLPNRAAADLADLDDATYDELWREVRDAVAAIRAAYRCDGVNVGINLGAAAGAGVPGHLHVHCVPRWTG